MFLFLGTQHGGSIRKYDAMTGVDLGDFTSGYLSYGGYSYSTFGPNNHLYVKMWDTYGSIHKFHGISGSYESTLISSSTGFNFLFNKNNELLALSNPPLTVLSATSNTVTRYHPITGANLGTFVPNTNRLAHALTMRWGPDDNLYISVVRGVSPNGSQAILRFDGTTGAFIDEFIPAGNSNLYLSWDFVFGPDNNIYCSKVLETSVTRFSGVTGQFMDVFASDSGLNGGYNLNGPCGVIFGPDENLYVASGSQNAIFKFDGTTGQFLSTFKTNTSSLPTFMSFNDPPIEVTRHFRYVGLIIQIISGIIDDSGGVQIVPGKGPQPVPPWTSIAQNVWEGFSKDEQDVLISFTIHELTGLINDKRTVKEIHQAMRTGLGKELSDRLELLIKTHNRNT